MKFTVGQIKKNAYNEPFEFDEWVDVSELEKMNNDIRKIDPVNVYGTVFDEGDEIIFSCSIDGKMILPCARTLVDVPYPFEIKATEVFSESIYNNDEELEDEIHPIDGEVLDLTPLIKENILLEVPYRVFSKDENATSQAPTEGEGWELISEDANEKKIDPRFKKLESLLNNEEKEK
ncbi:YceD family protein [Virgibacillus siamensis]|uniref:YceD family protein n=1 Tax=Virgibacillus siamensis TaxID=480071 RepID=UPI000986D140|nr:YceD family protein [Virgibacillus siamensis]